jgi:asparagine synthase (glutamine-hydrolysing)
VCGIAGAFGAGVRPQPAVLAALEHRGPDDSHAVTVEGGWLGARRLSIVDVDGGRQPVRSGRITVAMNGEVFNHEMLRKDLAANGVVFRTGSDTEVVAALIDEVGLNRALERMEGQFAVAATDGRQLWLARDRLGQKPLYWTLRDGQLRFGSELKALLLFPGQPRRVDPTAVRQLLLWEYIPAPRSIYTGIQKLERGCWLHFDAGAVSEGRWWTPRSNPSRRGMATEKWQDAIRTSLYAATRKRATTQLPVAVMLSGGIDSSAVAGLVKQVRKERPRTFSVTFGEQSFDESGPARQMAEHLDAVHTEVPFPAERLPEVMKGIQSQLCEPMADGSLLATWVLGQAIRAEGFKIALSGDGADEHFGGYPTYAAHSVARLPGKRLLKRVAARIPGSTANLSTGYKARRFTAGMGLPLARRNQVWLGALLPEEVHALCGMDESVWAPVDAAAAQVHGDAAQQAMGLDQRLYLSEGVLVKADRASMMHSVELRSPFLDHRVCELALEMPTRLKVSGRQTKVALRAAVADLMPKALVNRPKKGFGTPLGPWLRGQHAGLLQDLPSRVEALDLDPNLVARWCTEHNSGHRDHRRRLWTLLTLASWLEGPWGPKA